jgi:colanic acid/amylovoran biosynthesis glycosyltransferase
MDPRRIRLCIVQPNWNVVSETFIQAHAERLPAEVTVIHGYPPQIGGNPAPSIGMVRRGWLEIRRRLFHYRTDWMTEQYFSGLFRRVRADAILAEYGPTGTLIHGACKSRRLPLIVHFHGYDASHRETIETHRSGYQALFRDGITIIAVSKAMQQRLISLGANPDQVVYNPYGVDTSLFEGADPTSAGPTFLGVGRFVEKKAPQLTLLAFERVSRVYPEARLRWIGDGPLFGPCRDLAIGLGIMDKVDFLGKQPSERVRQEMKMARGFVQHSVEASDGDCEGTPVAILEAGATGLPVIATRHAGIPDVVIEGKTGLLVDERDVPGMATQMRKILEEPLFAGELGRNAREHIRANHSMAASIDRLWQIIHHAVGKMK